MFQLIQLYKIYVSKIRESALVWHMNTKRKHVIKIEQKNQPHVQHIEVLTDIARSNWCTWVCVCVKGLENETWEWEQKNKVESQATIGSNVSTEAAIRIPCGVFRRKLGHCWKFVGILWVLCNDRAYHCKYGQLCSTIACTTWCFDHKINETHAEKWLVQFNNNILWTVIVGGKQQQQKKNSTQFTWKSSVSEQIRNQSYTMAKQKMSFFVSV